MRKLILDAEALHVQTFSTGTAETVRGLDSTEPSACCGTGCTDPPCRQVYAHGCSAAGEDSCY
jgi:hypothetical protein